MEKIACLETYNTITNLAKILKIELETRIAFPSHWTGGEEHDFRRACRTIGTPYLSFKEGEVLIDSNGQRRFFAVVCLKDEILNSWQVVEWEYLKHPDNLWNMIDHGYFVGMEAMLNKLFGLVLTKRLTEGLRKEKHGN